VASGFEIAPEKLEPNSRWAYQSIMSTPRWFVLCLVAFLNSYLMVNAAVPRVDVILWFDTEDYLSPADDDACKRLAEMLGQRHIRATFKVVGEKARVLERRGRHDVIEALQKHDIGFHANFHSVHPTPTEYLADCGLLDGMTEFVRREGGGAADVRRVFRKSTLVCYGQPGSSWAPQAVAALKRIGVAPSGVPCYVDEGEHVGLDNKPFWYAGALNVYHMGPNYTRMELHDPAAVEPAKQKVSEIARRLQDKDGGGLISIFYHPCEWIHLEFWDGVNFRRGANPPPELWKAPPQRTAAETDAAFVRFGQYLDYIQSIPGVRFVTAGDLPSIYPDPIRAGQVPVEDVSSIAAQLTAGTNSGVDYLVVGKRSYSPADQFELLTSAVMNLIANKAISPTSTALGLLGPDSDPPTHNNRTRLDWPAFQTATADVANYINVEHRIPSRVFIGPDPIAPAVFLAGMAQVFTYYQQHKSLPVETGVHLPESVELMTTRHIAEDTPGLFGGWIIHKENFRAPKVMQMARLQAWTLKPAIRTEQ
jgi:hypothetical protein